MLVLSRKKTESIVIDDRIVVTVAEIRGNRILLGIEADPSVRIHRREVWLSIQESKRADAAV